MYVNIHYSNEYHNAKNCWYINHGTAKNEEQFKRFVAFDHVFYDFKDDYRSSKNFIGTSVAALDCDNDHSENEDEWITFKKLTEYFPNVLFIFYTSRHHMKIKGSKGPRPRFHILFLIERINSEDEYKALLKRLQNYLPVFDENAFDAGRFFFGNKEAEVNYHEGETSIIDFLKGSECFDSEPLFQEPIYKSERSNPTLSDFNSHHSIDIIPEGMRNSTLSIIAAKLIKRYGDTGTACSKFMLNCNRCSPPLDSKEIDAIWKSAQKFYKQKVLSDESYIMPGEFEQQQNSEPKWDKPVPFDERNLPTFPINTLPDTVRDYVTALAESTQTPVDMCAVSVLAVLALCIQGKFKIQGKPDWIEPMNLYVISIAKPSERKSAVISAVSKPITAYEAEENKRRAPEIQKNLIELGILEKKKQKLEKKASENKEKVSYNEILDLAKAIAELKVKKPLKLYVDDITTEKLISALTESGKTAILSSEGGIFDLLKGMYSKTVNIDVLLKAHSGDPIRLDRVGRESESIENPALTILLTVQPSVISGVMNNNTFHGRGLTARFLYCFPRSLVGTRRFNTEPIPNEAKCSYRNIIWDMLDEDKTEPEIINLSPDALKLIEEFSEELEPKLKGEYEYFNEWAGKLAGTILRFAGILTRASIFRCTRNDFDNSSCEDEDTLKAEFDCLETPPLVVSADTMQNAITLGSYFIQHAKAAYDLMGADETTEDAKYILNAVTKRRLDSFTRRDVMRICQKFKKAADVQPALDLLTDRGFLWEKVTESKGFQKPKGSTYIVNPMLYEDG